MVWNRTVFDYVRCKILRMYFIWCLMNMFDLGLLGKTFTWIPHMYHRCLVVLYSRCTKSGIMKPFCQVKLCVPWYCTHRNSMNIPKATLSNYNIVTIYHKIICVRICIYAMKWYRLDFIILWYVPQSQAWEIADPLFDFDLTARNQETVNLSILFKFTKSVLFLQTGHSS